MSTLTNGRVRKSLADQIDRLDHTLDNLADGLQEAVETAVQEAVRRVLAEVLATADLQARLQAARQPAEPLPSAPPCRTPSFLSHLLGRLGQSFACGRRSCGQVLGSATSGVADVVRRSAVRCAQGCRRGGNQLALLLTRTAAQVGAGLRTARQAVQFLRPCAEAVLLTGALSVTLALATYHATPWMAALVVGSAGFVAGLGVQLGGWVRLTWQRL